MHFDEVMATARQQIYQGDYDSAITLLTELNGNVPDNPDIMALLAESHLFKNRNEAARGYIERARELDPESSEVLRVLSRLYLADNQVDKALEAASSAVRGAKSNGKNYVVLAAVHCKMRDFDKAENFLNIAIDLDPDNPEAYYYKALIANQTKRYPAAVRILKKVLDENPALDKFWYMLSIACNESNSPKKALEAIDKALAINADTPGYSIYKGEILSALNQNQEAVELLLDYQRKFGPDAQSLTLLGHVHFMLGKHDEALRCFDAAIEHDPRYAQAYKHKAKVLSETDELESAVEWYEQALELDPGDAAVMAEIGHIHSKMHRNEKAESFLDKALRMDGTQPLAYLYKGHHYILNQDLDNAAKMFEMAVELPYKSPGAYAQLARLKAREGRFAEAVTLLNEAHRLFPANQNILACYSDFVACLPPDYPLSKCFLGKVHLSLASVWNKFKAEDLRDDETIKKFLNNMFHVLRSYKIMNVPFKLSQIFRGEALKLNCTRCKAVFEFKNIIPEVCFGCYKVVLTFAGLADCIRYNFYMDGLDPHAPIRRKLMIDSRGSSKGVLKGFYYTRDWDEAHRVRDHLHNVMAEKLGDEFSVKVKRGCSEFQDVFPDYNTLDSNGEFVMKCPDSWKEIEADFYERRNFTGFAPETKYDDLGLTLTDAYIIRNWLTIRKMHGHDDFQVEATPADA